MKKGVNDSVISVDGKFVLEGGSTGEHSLTSPVTGETSLVKGGLITGGNNPYGLGGGITVNADAVMSFVSGTIAGNVAMNGGGICVRGSLTIYSGANIAYNETMDNGIGGGILLFGANPKLIMNGGKIYENYAAAQGGGVNASSGTFNLNDGEISNNKSPQAAGIMMQNDSSLNISGGAVINNTATNGNYYGGGISYETDCSVFLEGSPKITGNKTGNAYGNLYVAKNKPLQIKGSLTKGANIGLDISSSYVFATGFLPHNANKNPAEFFKSDNAKYNCIRLNGNEVSVGEHSFSNELSKDESGHWRSCANCGQKTEFAAHTSGEWIIDTEAQIGVAGGKHKECTVCNYTTETAVIPALPEPHTHTYALAWSSDENGHYHAATCEHTELKAGFAAHDYGEWQIVQTPTCTAEGVKKRICGTCGYEQTDSVAVDHDAHSWNDGSVTTSPTCTESGVKTFTCAHNSAHTKTESIAATGHNWSEWTVTSSASCTEKGEEARSCANNSAHTETREIAALGHDFESEFTVDKQPTCTEKGIQSKHCSRCDEKTEIKEIDVIAHSLVHVERKDATADAEGNTEYWVCEECAEYFSDGEGKSEITDKRSVVIAKLEKIEDGNGLSAGAIAGITIGVIIAVLIIAYVVCYFSLYRRQVLLKGKAFDALYSPMSAIFDKKPRE